MKSSTEQVNQDIFRAKELLAHGRTSSHNDEHYCSVYPFTNENLRAYLPTLDLKGKDVLTVAASGDQTLNMALLGAKNIDCFDITRFAYYWLELKKAGIMTLSYDNFMNHFVGNILNSKNKNYKTMRKELAPDTQRFWDEIYPKINKRFFNPHRFSEVYETGLIKKRNLYLDNNNYDELKKKLSIVNLNFIHSNLLELPQETKKKYDAIFTSNIYDHLVHYPKREYKNFCENDIRALLKEHGIAQIILMFRSKWLPGYEQEFGGFAGYKVTTVPHPELENETSSFVELHKD